MSDLTPLRDQLETLSPMLNEHLPFSPHDFLRRESFLAADRAMFAEHLTRPLAEEVDLRMRYTLPDGLEVGIFAEILPWDSQFFGYPVARINAILPLNPPLSQPKRDYAPALAAFNAYARSRQLRYIFGVIETTDLASIRSLGVAGYTLIETRATYHIDLRSYAYSHRFASRKATLEDAPRLAETARVMVNDYDRFHADPFISAADADRMMERWIYASLLEGFADVTIVPDLPEPKAFCTVKYHRANWERWGIKLAQPVFSAVDPSFAGWYVKIISEINYHLKDEIGAQNAYLTTQVTNKAVLRSWEKLGYGFGKAEHVFRIVL
jgi:hypothetical protein